MSATSARLHGRGLAFDQIVASDQIRHARRGRRGADWRTRRRRRLAGALEIEVEQAMRVIKSRAQHLSAGQILERRGDATAKRHRGGVQRLGEAEPRQRGAIGAHQEDRLDHIPARLFDRKRGDAPIVERPLAHYAVDAERELLGDLRRADLRNLAASAPLVGKQGMRIANGALAAFDRDIHQTPPVTRIERGRAASSSPATNRRSTPSVETRRGWPAIARRNLGAAAPRRGGSRP